MARQRKPVNYNEEIEKIDLQITKLNNTIKELQTKKSALLQEKEMNDIKMLHDAIITSGLSVEDVLTKVKKYTMDNMKEPA